MDLSNSFYAADGALGAGVGGVVSDCADGALLAGLDDLLAGLTNPVDNFLAGIPGIDFGLGE